jgi:hypothetical protein
MTKLTDLSEQELAALLDLPLDKARRWLEVAKSVSEREVIYKHQPWFSKWLELESESATSLQRSSVKDLMGALRRGSGAVEKDRRVLPTLPLLQAQGAYGRRHPLAVSA